MLAGMLVASPALAGDSRSPDNAWARLSGENTEERAHEIRDLSMEHDALVVKITNLEKRLGEESVQYQRDPASKIKDQLDLRDTERELKNNEAAADRLREGMKHEGKRLLDLSAHHVGNEKIASYYEKNQISFNNNALYFNATDGTRPRLDVGPGFTDADFFFEDGGNDLLVVLTTMDGQHMTLQLDDGYFAGFYHSNEHGKKVLTPLEN